MIKNFHPSFSSLCQQTTHVFHTLITIWMHASIHVNMGWLLQLFQTDMLLATPKRLSHPS